MTAIATPAGSLLTHSNPHHGPGFHGVAMAQSCLASFTPEFIPEKYRCHLGFLKLANKQDFALP